MNRLLHSSNKYVIKISSGNRC